MEYNYRPEGVCSQLMEIGVEDGRLTRLNVIGGCSGNLQGIAKLCQGMDIDEIITRLSGIRCGRKASSCPDQLARALKLIKENEG